jgi:hypothetical protein
MGHQIGFHEAGCGFIPLVTRANGDLLFEERSRSGGRDAMPLLFALRLENPVCGSLPHREELGAALLAQLEMSMPHKPTPPALAGKGSVAWRRCGWPLSMLGAAPVALLGQSGVVVDVRSSAWAPLDDSGVGWHTCVPSRWPRQTHRA